MLCWFLLYSNVSQLYIHIYPLCFAFPSQLSHHKAMSRFPVLYSFRFSLVICFIIGVYLWQSQSPNSSHPASPLVSIHLLCRVGMFSVSTGKQGGLPISQGGYANFHSSPRQCGNTPVTAYPHQQLISSKGLFFSRFFFVFSKHKYDHVFILLKHFNQKIEGKFLSIVEFKCPPERSMGSGIKKGFELQ